MSRSIIVWGCVLLSLALGAARSLSWEYRHDEGTTVDVSIHAMTLGEYIPDWPAPPVSMTEITDRLEGRTGYTMGETVAALSTNFRTIHPPLYYLGVNLWTRAFGSGRLVMRLPALLLTALAVLGMALIARRVIPDRNAGLWAAALFALSPWVISLTNLARPYQLALFLAVWATVAACSESRWASRPGCRTCGTTCSCPPRVATTSRARWKPPRRWAWRSRH